MKFRWKVLVLLLVLAISPIAVMRIFGLQAVRNLGDQLVSSNREHLVTMAERQLDILVKNYSETMSHGRQQVEMALLYQAAEVENVLKSDPPDPVKIYFAEQFNHEIDLPLDTRPSPLHVRTQVEGQSRLLNVSYNYQVFKLSPGVVREQVQADITRLSTMTPVYQQINHRLQKVVLWQYTSLADGLLAAYPAHDGIPRRLDSRQQVWYTEAFDPTVLWSKPYVDPATRQVVVAASTPVKRPDGRAAGVTALVVPIRRMLENRLLTRNLPEGSRIFLCYLDRHPDRGEAAARILAREDYADLHRRSWRTELAGEWLLSEDLKQYRAMMADFKNDTGNMRRMPYKGRDSLWVYGLTHRQAFLVVVAPYDEILRPAVATQKEVEALIGALITSTGIGISVIVIMAVLTAFAFSRTVTRPIRILEEGARRLSNGDFDARVTIRSRDEFGRMGQIFNMVGPRLKEHYRMRRSLDLAREVQRNLLPASVPKVGHLDIAGKSLYCDETGGDYYDFLRIGPFESDRIAVVVGDVSGHGIPSALMMTTVRALLRQRSAMGGDLAEIVTDVNRQMVPDVDASSTFMTLFFCEVDAKRRQVRWVRAGHDPAIVYDAGRDAFEELSGEGVLMGADETIRYRQYQRTLAPGQVVVIATDGIWETRNAGGRMFGKEALRKLIRTHADLSADGLVNTVLEELERFRQPVKMEDDVTLVVIKVLDRR